jgi:Zn-dependent protease with chaperone function
MMAIGASLIPIAVLVHDSAAASDAELRHMLIRVVIIGTIIIGVSTAILILFFRSFEKEAEGKGSFRPTLLMIALIGSILFGCLLLLMISFVRR